MSSSRTSGRQVPASAFLLLLGLAAAILSACSATGTGPSSGAPASVTEVGTTPPFIPQIISSEQVAGANRLLIGLVDPSTPKSIGGPDTKVTVALTSGSTTIPSAPATFVWAIQGERGIYVLDVTYPSAGSWTASITATGGGLGTGGTVGVQYDVVAKGSAIPVGAAAPATKTPTLSDVGGDVKQIATDPNPDPSFYTTSVDQALAGHQPFVLIFATPAFCTSGQCGPTLDAVKAIAKTEPGVTFINVEPYKLEFTGGRLQPILSASNQLQPTGVTETWGILSEPWVFVVDRTGIVRASFEAVVAPNELTAAIDAIK